MEKKTPMKYPSTPHWPWSQSVHRDDSYHQNPEYFVGKEVVITEKLDGGNTCLFNKEVFARSTGQPATQGWFSMVKKHHAWKTDIDDIETILYGEDIFGIHSLEYDPVKETDTFYLFAIRFNPKLPDSLGEMDIFQDWDHVEKYAIWKDLKVVPVVFKGTFKSVKEITDFFEAELKKPSALGPEKEGFVMRIASTFDAKDFALNVCKYVRKNHVQTDQHWTKNWKPCKLK